MRAVLFAILGIILVVQTATAGTLDKVRSDGVFRIGYRTDAQPFAYQSAIGEPEGYAVDLCREVAAATKQALGLGEMKVEYVTVTAEDRFEAVKDGRVDILCDPATVTLTRREIVDFSLFTFVDGASVLYRADGPQGFEGLAGQKVGVHADTTTEEKLKAALAKIGVEAEIVPVPDHKMGLERLANGEFAAYFADRAILAFLLFGSDQADKLKLSDQYFSQEPYALAIARGDDDFRLLVDRTLAGLYRSEKIVTIFAKSFGKAMPSDILRVMYSINALEE
ncbi:MAG: amino acid ABC transporter substrate-binding protein [Dongiaceae bacterium]